MGIGAFDPTNAVQFDLARGVVQGGGERLLVVPASLVAEVAHAAGADVLAVLGSAERAWDTETGALDLPPPDADPATRAYDIYLADRPDAPAETAIGERDVRSRVDRASAFSMIFRIKLPLLRNALFIGGLLMIIANFNDFAKIWAMTQGGPGYSTTTLVIYVYRQAFENFSFGYASAIGVCWLLLLLLFAVAYLRALRLS